MSAALLLRNVRIERPVLVASGPLTATLELLEQADTCGAGAAVLKLTFVRVPFPGQMRAYSVPGRALLAPIDKRLDIFQGVALARRAKQSTSLPLFANPGATGDKLDEWLELTGAFENAGVDGLELNFCCPNLDVSALSETDRRQHGGSQIGQNPEQCHKITSAVRKHTELPIICKLLPNGQDPLASARACEDGGADAVHIVGLPAAGLPHVDLEHGGTPRIQLTSGVSFGALNGPTCLHSTFMATAVLARALKVPVICSGGIGDWRDCASAMMWGASAVAVCTAAIWHGFEVIRAMTADLQDFLDRQGHGSWLDLRGASLHHLKTPDRIEILSGQASVCQERCIGCGRCTKPGHCTAVTLNAERTTAVVDAKQCLGCGVCASLCPVGAISMELAD